MNVIRTIWSWLRPDPEFWKDYADWLDEFLYGDERF